MKAREIMAALAAPFPVDAISWRLGPTTKDKTKGQALAYVDARDVMRRFNEVLGMDWQCEYVSMANGTCCCRIGVKVGAEWIWRSNGAVNLTDSDRADAKEMAEKGSYSDAFKRAAVLFGVAAYLYEIDSPWVAIEQRGNSQVISPSEQGKLRAALNRRPVEVSAATPAPVERTPAPPAPAPAPQSISQRATAATQPPRAQPAMSAPAATRTAPAAPQNPVEAQSAKLMQEMLDALHEIDELSGFPKWDEWAKSRVARLTDVHRNKVRDARMSHRAVIYKRESLAA